MIHVYFDSDGIAMIEYHLFWVWHSLRQSVYWRIEIRRYEKNTEPVLIIGQEKISSGTFFSRHFLVVGNGLIENLGQGVVVYKYICFGNHIDS